MYCKTISLMCISGLLLLASCSRRQYPQENPDNDNRYPQRGGVYGPRQLPPGQAKKVYGDQHARNHTPARYRKRPYGYRPPLIIVVDRNYALCDNRGQWYYHNEYGYRYWQKRDGRYYLDEQYARDYFRDDDGDEDRKYKKKHKHKHSGRRDDDD